MNTYRIGEAAKATGLSAHTIRFYEGRGLLQPAARSESGYRRYDEADLRRLRLIQNARTLGIPLDEVQGLLTDIHGSTCGAYADKVIALVDRQRQETDQRISELQRIRAELDSLAADATAASGSSQLVADCPCCLLMDDGSAGAGYCSPSTSSIADRFTEDMLEVLQCDIGARPDAPTPDDLAPNLQSVAIARDQLVVRFERSAAEAVRQFAAAECVCCGGMGWEVSETADVVDLTVSGTRAQLEVMATAWPVPEAAL
ncbi:MerR family transcriptional regulator [bacterium]|nr:MerR family transcriptional regulator [bacterium]